MDGESTGGEIGSTSVRKSAREQKTEREEPSPSHHSLVPPVPGALRQITTH